MTQSEIEAAPDVTALVARAQAGDRVALDQLIATHLPVIYNVVGRALGGHADVDDLVQDTMIKVIRGLPGLREPDRFRAWAVTIAYRQVQRYLRDRRRSGLRVREAPPELPDPRADFADEAVSALAISAQRRELARAARWLDDGDRQLLALWWQEAAGELTREEVATALSVNAKHAAVRLQRLRERLDATRGVVRALAARPRCPELAGQLRGWAGAAGPLWRKRLVRHTRDCARCAGHRRGLVPLEQLLLGVSALPVPAALAAGVKVAAGGSFPAGPGVLGYLHNKLLVAAGAPRRPVRRLPPRGPLAAAHLVAGGDAARAPGHRQRGRVPPRRGVGRRRGPVPVHGPGHRARAPAPGRVTAGHPLPDRRLRDRRGDELVHRGRSSA
jgi:RNA polymerase sigma factor (sigma-70 family)